MYPNIVWDHVSKHMMCTGLCRHNYAADPSGHAVSALAWLLCSLIQSPLRGWIFCIVFIVSSWSRRLCVWLIGHSEESYRLCVCVCMWVCEWVSVCECVSEWVSEWVCVILWVSGCVVCVWVCVSECECVWVWVCEWVCVWVCVFVWVNVCVCVCVCE